MALPQETFHSSDEDPQQQMLLAVQPAKGKRRVVIGMGAVALLLFGTAAFMMKEGTTSMDEHSEEYNLLRSKVEGHSIGDSLILDEELLNHTFQPRNLLGLSSECKTAMDEERKTHLKRAAVLIMEKVLECKKSPEGTIISTPACTKVLEKLKNLAQAVKEECRASGNICTIKETEYGSICTICKYSDEDEMCMPSVCHKHSQYIGAAMTIIKNKQKKCNGCTVHVSC